jgi:light-regulated signal transduction histidine kinase (bacteriophytochrome)
VLQDLEARIKETGAQIDVQPLPAIEAEKVQVGQLMQNLVANALKFHKPGQPPVVRISALSAAQLPVEIRDSLSEPECMCHIVVEDNGIGFDQKHVLRIFGVFQRLHTRKAYEGTGIGLAVCHKIVERHGGHIDARGVEGEGAVFTVSLPLTQASE